MDSKDWLCLKVLFEKGSVTKASEALYISQPALSKRIRVIENEFDIKLLLRGVKGIRFTPEGEYLVAYANEMLSRFQEVKDELHNMDVLRLQGALRIAAPTRFAHQVLPSVIAGFSASYPFIKTQIRSGYTVEILKWLKDDELHVAFAREDIRDENYSRHLICGDYICLASKDRINVEDLPHLPRVAYVTDPYLHVFLEEWWQSRFSVPMKIGMHVGDSQTCIEMLRQGIGYAIVPYYCLRDQEQGLNLAPLYDKNGKLLIRYTYMVYAKKYSKFPIVNNFVNHVKKLVDGDFGDAD